MIKWLTIVSALVMLTCKESNSDTIIIQEEVLATKDSIEVLSPEPIFKKMGWTQLSPSEYALDIKYATGDNFTKNIIYPCAACFVRDTIAVQLEKINDILNEKYGYKLKLFDCYRPAPAQEKLWSIMPNPSYVTNPKKGSQHNKGLAIDATIIDTSGTELDMGTPFDFFGKESHYLHPFDDKSITNNRILLRSLMEQHGLEGIRTEWWHFSMKSLDFPVESWEWPCDSLN